MEVQTVAGKLSTTLTHPQMMTKWSSTLNPLIANPLNNVTILKNVALINGVTNVNHLLQKTQQGWFLTDIQGPATIYRSAPFNALTLTLTSNVAVVVDIGVF